MPDVWVLLKYQRMNKDCFYDHSDSVILVSLHSYSILVCQIQEEVDVVPVTGW